MKNMTSGLAAVAWLLVASTAVAQSERASSSWAISGDPFVGGMTHSGTFGFGAMGSYYVPLSRRLELRTAAELGWMKVGETNGPELMFMPALRVSIDPVYALEFGPQLGVVSTSNYAGIDARGADAYRNRLELAVGVRFDFATFRLGAERQFEIKFWQAFSGLPIARKLMYVGGLALGYVLR